MSSKDPVKLRVWRRAYEKRTRTRGAKPRAKTLSGNPLRVPYKLRVVADYPEGIERPRTRGECAGGARPCPFVSCRHHLFLDVNEKGGLKLNFPHLEPDELIASCSLDVADAGLSRLEDAGALMNLTRERIRQLEVLALRKLERKRVLRELVK